MRRCLLVMIFAACGTASHAPEPPVPSQPQALPDAAAPAELVTPSPPAPAKPVATLPPTEAPEEAEPDPFATLPAVTVTALSFAKVGDEARNKSKKLNVAALRAHRNTAYAEAETLYRQALAANPANLVARYNLSCVYNLSGRSEMGLALLYEIAKTKCEGCQKRVSRAEWDDEWRSHWMNPILWAIVLEAWPAEGMPDLYELSDLACPKGTKAKGKAPDSETDLGEMWCAKPNGTMHGPSLLRTSEDPIHDATVDYVGHYRNNKKHGYWVEPGRDGYYDQDKQHGHWVYHTYGYRAGVENIAYVAGKRHGAYTSTSDDGQPVAQGAYAQGKRQGVWTLWDEDGHKLERGEYAKGVPHGQFEFWDVKGKSIARFTMQNGTGDWSRYNESRQQIERGRLLRNKRHGTWTERTRLGASAYLIKAVGSYKKGKRTGPWLYHTPDGALYAKGSYKGDAPEGPWIIEDSKVQNLEFRRGKLIRINGRRADADDERGYEEEATNFPAQHYPITEEEMQERDEIGY